MSEDWQDKLANATGYKSQKNDKKLKMRKEYQHPQKINFFSDENKNTHSL